MIASLKRDVGKIEMKMIVRCGEPVTDNDLKPYLRGWRRVTRANTVGIFLDTNGVAINGNKYESQLDIPQASLVEYDGKTLKIYQYGIRKMNKEEHEVYRQWKAISDTPEYKQRAWNDAMTDGSSTYYQEKYFFKDKGYNYLFGFDWEKGRKADFNERDELGYPMIDDKHIKGKLLMVYKVREVA